MDEDASLGQIAYEAYGDSRKWRVFNGDRMPEWEDQQPDIQAAWEEAAKAVERACR